MKFEQLRGDIFGGITAGIVALPLALAFGVASGLGAAAGLYGAIALGLMAAIFGGTRLQISGPTGPMTVVSATIISHFTEINKPEYIFTTFMLAGIFLIMMGFMRLGQYVRYIPYPVVSGFMSGIGVIIILLQILPFFGLSSSPKILDGILRFGEVLSKANFPAVFLGTLSIVLIYIIPHFQKAVPATLIALILGTLVSVFMGFQVPTIGDIPSHLPALKLPVFSLEIFDLILIPAITLAALGAIDSLLTSVVADKLTKEKHDSNRELIGQGIGNTLAGLVGGLPGAGATMRTVVNINSGAKTRLSGVIHAFVLIAILFGLGRYASQIPMAVLAGILITVGISIIDYKGLKDIQRIPKSDAVVKIIVLGMTVFVDLLQAVGIGMVLASLLFVKRMGDLIEKHSRLNLHTIKWGSDGVVIVNQLSGPLFFGFSNAFEVIMNGYISSQHLKAIVMDMTGVPHIDQSGWYSLEEVSNHLEARDIPFLIVAQDLQPLKLIQQGAVLSHEYALLFASIEEAIQWLHEHMEEKLGDDSQLERLLTGVVRA